MDSITISTLNAQGIGSPEEVDNIIFENSQVKQDENSQVKKDKKALQIFPQIVCVQQANLPLCGDKLQHYKWLCSGQFGSAILIDKASTLECRSFEQVCEEICVAEVVTGQGIAIKVISCYIPPSTDYVCVTKDLWAKLIETLKAIPVNMTYVLAGDFNAEVGKEDVSELVGYITVFGTKLCHTTSNENGRQLTKLALNFHSTVLNTFGAHGGGQSESYTYKDETVSSQRSYIIVPTGPTRFSAKLLLQDCRHTWCPGYKSALVTRNLQLFLDYTVKITEKSNLVITPVTPVTPVTVSCWNVQGASPSVVDRALNESDLPLVCLQDVFLTSENDVKTTNYTWFTSKKLWGKNVGILIKNDSNYSMADFEVISENLCVGNVIFNGSMTKVVCCSLPMHTDSVKFQEVTGRLVDLVKNIPEGTQFVVAGDFNTHVNHTRLDDNVVFEEGDENGMFLKRFMRECHVELPYIPRTFVSHVSENVRKNSSFVLMSPSCMLKFSHIHSVLWVPFIENAIVILRLYESYTGVSTAATNLQNEDLDSGYVKCVDGLMYVTKTYLRMKRIVSIGTTDHQAYHFISRKQMEQNNEVDKSDLPEEIVTKYKNSPPPLDELVRILGKDFTLYLGFMQESVLPKGIVSELTVPFESLDRGMLFSECIDVFDEKTKGIVKRILKIRWNGIVVHEQEGGKFESYKRIFNKAHSVLFSTLGKHFFTVKARSSFYNNGLAPLCKSERKLKKVLRVMKIHYFTNNIKSFSFIKDVKNYIKSFIDKKLPEELVFGPDFTSHTAFVDSIKKYLIGREQKEGFRLWKSRKDLGFYDHISVFIQLSPTALRKSLMALPEHRDLRFQLIPPCGNDNDYFDWLDKWNEKVIPKEYFKPSESMMEVDTIQQETEPSVAHCNGNEERVKSPTIKDDCQIENNKRHTGFVEQEIRIVDEHTKHKIVKCFQLINSSATLKLPRGKRGWVKTARELTDLPQEDVDKYCETPPQQKVLRRILGDDFTLYYGFGRESDVGSKTAQVLAQSFEAHGHGGIMIENIEEIKNGKPSGRLAKFKWNGICIHMEAASVMDSYKYVSQKGEGTLVSRLGQHFYAVQAKPSYFNGTLPLCKDNDKLPETFKVVEESDIPYLDIKQPAGEKAVAIKKYITEFFTNDSDIELFFGPKFRISELLEPLKRFFQERKEFGYRLLKSKASYPIWDCIAIFIRRSPLEIRDKLMKIPDHQDSKFFLVPPCEFYNKSHYEWIMSWAAENSIDEYRLMFEKEKLVSKASLVNQRNQERKPTTPQKSNRSRIDDRRQQPRSDPTRSGSDIYDISTWFGNREAISYPVGRKRGRQQMDNDNYYQQSIRDMSSSQPSTSDNYAYDRAIRGFENLSQETDYYGYAQAGTGNEYQSQLPDDYAYDRSAYRDYSQSQEGYEQERKRPRQEYEQERQQPQPPRRQSRGAKVEKPRWDDLAPLVIIWPINIRSEHERDPRKVLEANFPTEVSLEDNNKVAVHVALPRRNGREQVYCMCKGDGVYNATKTALDLLVKHSSVIKHNLNYLPLDGQAPNFLRYRIPCQTNPRTYITLSWSETGALTKEIVAQLLESFKDSLNEDLYFDKDYYSHEMKQMILDLAPKYGLKVRHCGMDPKLVDRYVCVYKVKSKDEVLGEVLKMRDFHPKYRLATNKLPPRLGLNIF